MKDFVKQWNQKYFHNGLSENVLCILNEIDDKDSDLISFVESNFYSMYLAGTDPYDFSESLAIYFARIAKTYMPAVWSRIPSATKKNRMRYVNYLTETLLADNKKNIDFLDAACGFPPVTTIELAEHFTNWNIVGIDPNFPDYILTDANDVPAGFDSSGHVMFIQTTWKDNKKTAKSQPEYKESLNQIKAFEQY